MCGCWCGEVGVGVVKCVWGGVCGCVGVGVGRWVWVWAGTYKNKTLIDFSGCCSSIYGFL